MDTRSVEGNTRNEQPLSNEHSSAASRMLLAISLAADGRGSSLDEVDAAAKALVTELRSADQPPEQVLVQIKRILADAGLRSSHGSTDAAPVIERHTTLYRSVIESSIRHYFAKAEGPEPTTA
jgi:hypothetical protein